MKYNNSELLRYVDRIKFTQEDKRKYQPQIDNLIKSLSDCIKENSDTKVLKVLQAGSWKKGTILKADSENPVDIDLVFFLDIDDEDFTTLDKVNDLMIDFLMKVYPQKSRDDFWDNPKTSGLEFISSGLNVDIVPVKEIDDGPYVQQPDKSFSKYVTSPQRQIDFISARKVDNPNFTAIVRILKKWKNHNQLQLSSFDVELICAYLEINNAVETDILTSLIRFFKFLGKKKFPSILFGTGNQNQDDCVVYISDPTNDANNAAQYITRKEWKEIRNKANLAFERIFFANEKDTKGETIELWREVIDGKFNVEEL